MIHPVLPATLLALAVPAANVVDGASFAPDTVRVTQMTVRQRIIIRVPRVPMPAPDQLRRTYSAVPLAIRWKEKKGPKCVAVSELAGAMIVRPRTVDVALTTGKRIRAILDDGCQPLDFYSGFYIRPGRDGMICSDRDGIKVRSGATCAIDSFKTLVAAK